MRLKRKAEDVAKERYEATGWTVLNKGWPDLFMYKQREDGKTEIKIVEVKGRGDRLRSEQKIVLSLLSGLGIDCSTYYLADNREVVGAGEARMGVCAQNVMNFSEIRPAQQRYERTQDGGFIVPVKGVGAGFKVLYPCPKCNQPRHGLKSHQEGIVCGPCAKAANGGMWLPYEKRERVAR